MPNTTMILLISVRGDHLIEFSDALQLKGEVSLTVATTFEAAVHQLADSQPALIVVDEEVGGLSGLDVVRRLMEVNAFIDTAVLSSMDEETFHQHSEGLGILARLPLQAGKQDAQRLLGLLRRSRPMVR